jgi:hypothetical protein
MIAMFVADFPLPVVKIDKLKLSNKKGRLSAATVAKRVAATAVLMELRRMCPLKAEITMPAQHTSSYHSTPIYTVRSNNTSQSDGFYKPEVCLSRRPKLAFTLLPEVRLHRVIHPICRRFGVPCLEAQT